MSSQQLLIIGFGRQRQNTGNRQICVFSTDEKVVEGDIPLDTTVPSTLLSLANKTNNEIADIREAAVVPSKYSKPIKLQDLEDYVKCSIENAELEKQHEVIIFTNSALQVIVIISLYLVAAFSQRQRKAL